MTTDELNTIVAAVVAELEKSGVDFDYKAEQAEDDDLVFVIRGTAPNYQGVTVTWKGLLDIITAQATQAKNDAETAKNAANTILEQVQSKGTEITNFVATSKTEIETQKDESVNAVKSVYQSDINELKGDLDVVNNTTLHYKNGKNLFPYYGKIKNVYIDNTNGNEVSYSDWFASDYIKIEPSTDYQIFFIASDNIKYQLSCYYAYYDSSKSYISGGIADSDININSPSNANYIRVSFPNTALSKKSVFGKKTDFKNFTYDSFEYPQQVFDINDVVNVYGTGLILPFTVSDGKFKVEVYESFILYYVLRDGTKNVISIPAGTTYLINPKKALVVDTDTNEVVEIPRTRLKPNYILLLQTGEYVNNYTKQFSGFFMDRITTTTTYEEYDKNNVRKDYVRQVDDKITEIALDNPSDFSAIIGTDMHIVTTGANGTRPILNVINRVQERIHCNALLNLGDSVMMGKENPSEAYYSLQEVVGKIKDISNAYYCVGNHDYNHRSDVSVDMQKKSWVLPNIALYRILGKHHENDVVWGSKKDMYYYKDFEDEKIRIIFLNTLDKPEETNTIDGVEYDKYPWIPNIVSSAQIDWFIDSALNFSDKSNKSEWSVIICSHVTPCPNVEWNNASIGYVGEPALNTQGVELCKIAEAFVTGTSKVLSYSDEVFGGSATLNRNADFSSQGSMNLIGWFSGHNHIDTMTERNGITYVTTVCGYPYNTQDSSSMSGITMTTGTYTEFGLDVLSVNKTDRKAKLHRVGVGSDREWTY